MITPKTLIIIVGVLAIAAAAIFFVGVSEKEKTSIANYPTKEFHSKYGFTVTYPENWIVDDSQENAPAEFIREPNDRSFYSMQAHTDPRLTNSGELPKVYQDIENSFKNDASYLVEESGWEREGKNTANNSYFVSGSFTEGGKSWRFKELTIFSEAGNVLVLRGVSLKEYADLYGPVLDRIFSSVAQNGRTSATGEVSGITKNQARLKVEALSEVTIYKALLAKASKKAELAVEEGGAEWNVHVFEIVRDGATSHTATFGWYRVDKQTGIIRKIE